MQDSFAEITLLDAHVHYAHPAYKDSLLEIMQAMAVSSFNVVCTPHQQRLSLVPDALHLKAHAPGQVYVFGGLDISVLFTAPQTAGERFAACVDQLLAMGCDGIKMIEGKPQMRKLLPIPAFSSASYDPYWQHMAERGVPLLFHVNDPEEFWDAERVPQWARERDWFYGDGSYISNEQQYTEIIEVLDRYPDLKVIFAHFFFLSAQLPRLADYLDRYPNMMIDLTPGIEMYTNFAQNPQMVREFFLRYQDRIIFGTDIGAKALLATPEQGIEADESQGRIQLVRSFLEREGAFQLQSESGFLFGRGELAFEGIALPEPVLRKIYRDNFITLSSAAPRALNPGAIIAECIRLEHTIQAMGAVNPAQPGDTSIAALVKDYFMAL